MKQGYVYIKTLTMNTIKMEKECVCDWENGLRVIHKGIEINLRYKISSGKQIKLDKMYCIDGVERNYIENDKDLTCVSCGLPVKY